MSNLKPKNLTSIYEKWGEGLVQKHQQREGKWTTSRKFKGVVEAIKDFETSNGLILDAGSGTGNYTKWLLSETKCPVIAADITLRLLQLIQKEISSVDNVERLCLVRASLEVLPFKTGSFDRILCTQVIEHLPDDKSGSKELWRVLKKNGVLVLTTDNANNLITKVLEFPVVIIKKILGIYPESIFPHKEYDKRELRQLFNGAGFSILKEWTFRFTLPSPISRFTLFQLVLDRLERIFIMLPVLNGWGDIIAMKCQKK